THAEACSYVVLCDAARPPLPRLTIAEAQHEVPTAWRHRRREAIDVPTARRIVEHVVEPAVQDRIETLTQCGELQRIPHHKADRQPPLVGFCLGQVDGSA